MTELEIVDRSVEKAHVWINDLADELETDDRQTAFLRRIAEEAPLSGETEASFAASAAAKVLHRHISEGEMKDVAAVFPEGLRGVVAG